MNIRSVEIDPDSGFCGGVIRAIKRSEQFLSGNPGESLYSLGAIVHNEEELSRLAAEGLVVIGREDIPAMAPAGGKSLLIRAHGEPPRTYIEASQAGFNVIDCTCPVVLKLQNDIRTAWGMLPEGGQLLIFGKVGHAEVMGLVGQTDGGAKVVESLSSLRGMIASGEIGTSVATEVFSQTTKSPDEYAAVCDELRRLHTGPALLRIHDTICQQVASRHSRLAEFAKSHDVIVFVSGAQSSNGAVLFKLCKSVNDRTFHISSPSQLDSSWFADGDNVGVCGATSTPLWLLEQVSHGIENFAR